jgi:hypothetical protein
MQPTTIVKGVEDISHEIATALSQEEKLIVRFDSFPFITEVILDVMARVNLARVFGLYQPTDQELEKITFVDHETGEARTLREINDHFKADGMDHIVTETAY